MRHCLPVIVLAAAVLASGSVHAQSLLDTCHASSSYDVTITDDGVRFERAQPAPRRLYLHDGRLRVDGKPIALDAEDSDRVTVIENIVRDMEPKVKTIANRAVDLAAQAVREQAAVSAPQAAANGELSTRLDAVTGDLKARIARSHSSRDWHGPAFRKYTRQLAARVVPVLASDMLQQAVAKALAGNLDTAAQLRQRATHMATALRTRIRKKLQVLRPQVQTLCPSVQRIDQIESGIHTPLPGNVHIDVIDMATGKPQ